MKELAAFDNDVEIEIPRDRWGRPMIQCADDVIKPYRRASTAAEALDSGAGLAIWKQRMTARGMAARPDLALAVLTAKTDKEVDAIVEAAQEQAGVKAKATIGTALHTLTEMVDKHLAIPEGLSLVTGKMLEAYEVATRRFEVLESERFTVNDHFELAGTYDLRVRDTETGDILIGDKKTSAKLDYLALKAPAQVAVYAGGCWYDHHDGIRTSHGADPDKGLIIHLPQVDDPKDVVCEVRWLDLVFGRVAIQKAIELENFRKTKFTFSMPRI